jgi:hypothetical protein
MIGKRFYLIRFKFNDIVNLFKKIIEIFNWFEVFVQRETWFLSHAALPNKITLYFSVALTQIRANIGSRVGEHQIYPKARDNNR